MGVNRISTKESQLQDQIRLALGAVPGLCLWRNNIGLAEIRGYRVRFGVGGPGGADLIGIYKGRFVSVEIKTATNKQTAEQLTFQQLVERLGGIYVILRSVDEAQRWVGGLGG